MTKQKGYTRKKVLRHVVTVTRWVRDTDPKTSFAFPVSDKQYDEALGLFAWNDWFFLEFRKT